MDDNHKIIIRHISRDGKTGSGPASRWLAYLLLVPSFIIMAILGIFFFTAFLALFAVIAIGLGFRLWWLRRKLRQSTDAMDAANAADAAEGQYIIIEDAEIVEESTDKARKTDPRERQ